MSKMHGSRKSNAKSAPMDKKSGNTGKPIGDSGKKCKGNRRTRGAADRYK